MKDSVLEEVRNFHLSHVSRISLNIDLFIDLIDRKRRGRQTEPGCSKKVHTLKETFTLLGLLN